ncbi:hypothetical protein [Mycolicibacterium goodii]|uniref:hypothetical protein n=1 Tax=Mycolicibacterium goodii TaxID=134601 RepID=UPI001BDD5A39|nr:hypothetical protein [Mycolicibacterium goodii]MBU8834161.1 hypothetical protein [Mycolicibacterium goodii]
MTAPARYRKKPVDVDVMRWDGSDESAEALWEWTTRVVTTNPDGSPHMTTSQFLVLKDWANSDAADVLGEADEQRRVDEGYTAVVFDELHDTWVNVRTGDWIIRGVKGEFYPCHPDTFAETYEPVTP